MRRLLRADRAGALALAIGALILLVLCCGGPISAAIWEVRP